MISYTEPTRAQAGSKVFVVTPNEEPHLYGRVMFVRKDHCVVLLNSAVKRKLAMPLTFPATVDNVVYVIDVPEAKEVVVTPTAPKRVKPAPGESKIAKCKAIYAAYPFGDDAKADRAAVTQKFIDEVGCTAQGAVTYWHTCSKS